MKTYNVITYYAPETPFIVKAGSFWLNPSTTCYEFFNDDDIVASFPVAVIIGVIEDVNTAKD